MAQSLTKLYIHLVFHIKNTSPAIKRKNKEALYAYMGAIIKDNDSFPISVNGVCDHVHILMTLSKNISLAKIVEEIKRHSSRVIKTWHADYATFSWQAGYGGFSVSSSLLEKPNDILLNKRSIIERGRGERSIFSF